MTEIPQSYFEQVYAIVRRIPPGSVCSYGRIAAMLGRPKAARAVGYALNALKDKRGDPKYDNIPWHRVVNSQGRISIVNRDTSRSVQAELLKAEGVVVTDKLTINLDVYLWPGLHWLEIDDIVHGR